MSDHVAIVITAWATVGAAIAAFLAVHIGRRQGHDTLQEAHRATDATVRQAKVATAYQLITQLDAQWNSSAMRAKRQSAAQLLLPLQPLPENDEPDDIIDLFETLALCVQDDIIPLTLASHFFSYWLIPYWFAAAARVNHVRSKNPTIWEDLAAFMPTLLDYQARRRQRTVAEVTPTTEHLRKFLQEETKA